MNKNSPIKKRMDAAFKRLKALALERTPANNASVTHAKIGIKIGMSGQSVTNYVYGKGGNGYIIEALIEEFKKLPIPEQDK